MPFDRELCVSTLIYFLRNNGLYIDNYDEKHDTPLDIDSLTFITLIVLMEDEFAIKIPAEQLVLSNFDTTNKLIDNVSRLIEAEASARVAGECTDDVESGLVNNNSKQMWRIMLQRIFDRFKKGIVNCGESNADKTA
jgi:acyl carrier protein